MTPSEIMVTTFFGRPARVGPVSVAEQPPHEFHDRDETRSAIAALAPADMVRLVAAARIRCGRFHIDRADLGFRDLVSDAITGTLSGKRKWRRDVPLIQHLIMTMKSIASHRREEKRAEEAAGFRVERRGTMMPGTLKEEEDDDGRARPGMRTPSEESEEERIIAEDGIRVFRRHFADDPAALAVIM